MLAAAYATTPRLLLLDEPSAGASVSDLGRLADAIAQIQASGITLVIVEHNLRFVRAIADRVVVMADGRGSLVD
jgi:ABC-type branched-subunit amino acid transport system ATPase component